MTKQAKKKTQHEIPLEQALKDCRLAANLSIEDVALKLNLNVTVIRNIENNLAQVIAEKTYPSIYLRGYLANYAKAVQLLNLESFQQYQQLSHPEKSVISLKNPHILNEKKKAPTKLLLLIVIFILIVVAGFFVLNSGPSESTEPNVTTTNSENAEMRLPQASADPEVNLQTPTDQVPAALNESEMAGSNPDLTPIQHDDNTTINNAVESTPVLESVPVVKNELVNNEVAEKEVADELVQKNQAVVNESNVSSEVVTHSLVVKFKEDCWTEITDATGKRMALDLYKAGRELTLAGTPPFNLVLGNPFVVDLFYQGELVEREFKRGRTARFSWPE